jgi:hypothetical protein
MKKSDIERNWPKFKNASAEDIAKIKMRNAELRLAAKKDARISARINSKYLILFHAMALEQELKPNAFLSQVIHQLVASRDRSNEHKRQSTKKKS